MVSSSAWREAYSPCRLKAVLKPARNRSGGITRYARTEVELDRSGITGDGLRGMTLA
jgi:hypothetical protein